MDLSNNWTLSVCVSEIRILTHASTSPQSVYSLYHVIRLDAGLQMLRAVLCYYSSECPNYNVCLKENVSMESISCMYLSVVVY